MIAACALCAWAGAGFGQTAAVVPPQNVLQLSATGTIETQQDLLVMSLNTTREGPDAAAVQAQLKAALDAALAQARPQVQAGQMDVRTGNFSLYPRHDRDGRMAGWSGTAELVLQGRDFTRITQTAGRISTLTLGGISFGLSREQRQKVEAEAQQQAIGRFQAKAGELARAFGFTAWSLREVSVDSGEPGYMSRPRMMDGVGLSAASASAVPVEAGKATVVVTVSGSVQLR